MRSLARFVVLLVALCWLGEPEDVWAHGSPTRWSAESTDFGCWLSRWLENRPGGDGAEAIVAVQVVFGRIIPARGGMAQPGITKPELDGAVTLNVRIVDPSIRDADSVAVVRPNLDPVQLDRRQMEGAPGDFPSFFLTGAAAQSVLDSLRMAQVSGISVRRPDGSDVRISNTGTGLAVAVAMYDACIRAKPRK